MPKNILKFKANERAWLRFGAARRGGRTSHVKVPNIYGSRLFFTPTVPPQLPPPCNVYVPGTAIFGKISVLLPWQGVQDWRC